MKKKFLASLALSGLFLTACTNSDAPGSGTEFPGANYLPEQGARLVIGEANEGLQAAEDYVKAFEEKYAEYDIKVEITQFSDQSFVLDAPAGKGQDLFICAQDRSQFYAAQLIMPLDPAIVAIENNQDIPQWAWDAFKYEGKNYAYPLTIQTTALFYRKSLVPAEWKDENGELNVKTWNDMYKLNIEINSGKYAGLEKGIIAGMDNFYKNFGVLNAYGAELFGNDDRLGTDLAAGEAEKGAAVIRDMASTMYEEVSNWEVYNQIANNIADGKFVGTIETPNKVLEIAQSLVTKGVFATQEEALADIGSMPLPMLPKSGDITSTTETEFIPCPAMGGCTGVFINAYTQYPNASRLLASFITQEENQLNRAMKSALTPCRTSALESDSLPKYLKDVFLQAENNGLITTPTMAEMSQVWGPGGALLTKLTYNHVEGSKEYYQTANTVDKIKGLLEKATNEINQAIEILG